MRPITVKTADLIKVMQENRGIHVDTFMKAQKVYRVRMIEELDQMLKDAQAGNNVKRAITMPEPQNHADDYDRVIKMMEMHDEDRIELDEQDAAMYVMDQWSWKGNWTATTTAYLAT